MHVMSGRNTPLCMSEFLNRKLFNWLSFGPFLDSLTGEDGPSNGLQVASSLITVRQTEVN